MTNYLDTSTRHYADVIEDDDFVVEAAQAWDDTVNTIDDHVVAYCDEQGVIPDPDQTDEDNTDTLLDLTGLVLEAADDIEPEAPHV